MTFDPASMTYAPPYGSLTHAQGRLLYERNRYVWIEYVKAEMARLLAVGDDRFVNDAWPALSHEYKTAVWNLLTAEQRNRIREVRKGA